MKFVTVYIARFNIISILLQKHSTMSLQQYNLLMSNLLNEKHTLAKLREKLEGRRGKLCRSYKGFGHLARNCRNRGGNKKGKVVPQNKFEILSSRVMRCEVELRRQKRRAR